MRFLYFILFYSVTRARDTFFYFLLFCCETKFGNFLLLLTAHDDDDDDECEGREKGQQNAASKLYFTFAKFARTCKILFPVILIFFKNHFSICSCTFLLNFFGLPKEFRSGSSSLYFLFTFALNSFL